jgi:hypothetical protein
MSTEPPPPLPPDEVEIDDPGTIFGPLRGLVGQRRDAPDQRQTAEVVASAFNTYLGKTIPRVTLIRELRSILPQSRPVCYAFCQTRSFFHLLRTIELESLPDFLSLLIAIASAHPRLSRFFLDPADYDDLFAKVTQAPISPQLLSLLFDLTAPPGQSEILNWGALRCFFRVAQKTDEFREAITKLTEFSENSEISRNMCFQADLFDPKLLPQCADFYASYMCDFMRKSDFQRLLALHDFRFLATCAAKAHYKTPSSLFRITGNDEFFRAQPAPFGQSFEIRFSVNFGAQVRMAVKITLAD